MLLNLAVIKQSYYGDIIASSFLLGIWMRIVPSGVISTVLPAGAAAMTSPLRHWQARSPVAYRGRGGLRAHFAIYSQFPL